MVKLAVVVVKNMYVITIKNLNEEIIKLSCDVENSKEYNCGCNV